MLKGRKSGESAAGGVLNSILGEGSQLNGKLRVKGSIRVDGEFEGRLTASDAVVVGRTGCVRADLEAREIVIGGRVEGRLVAQERVELQTGARVEGDVWAQSFVIAEGVSFNGGCCMGEEARGAWQAVLQGMDMAGPSGVHETPGSLAVVDSVATGQR